MEDGGVVGGSSDVMSIPRQLGGDDRVAAVVTPQARDRCLLSGITIALEFNGPLVAVEVPVVLDLVMASQVLRVVLMLFAAPVVSKLFLRFAPANHQADVTRATARGYFTGDFDSATSWAQTGIHVPRWPRSWPPDH